MSALLLLLLPLAGLAFLFDGPSGPAAPDPEDGTEGDDEMIGSDNADHLRGGAGDDVISGLGGADILEGGDGDDFIEGRGGDDTVHGGDGQDHLSGGRGDDSLHGGEDNDKLRGLVGDDIVHGDGGNDLMSGGEGSDALYGGTGNDQLHGGEDDDILYGGEGDDRLDGDKGDDTLHGGAGDDTLRDRDGDNILHGGAGDDTLYGYTPETELYGDAGNDLLKGTGVMHGGAGEDTLLGTGVLQGGAGDDLVRGSGILRGGTGADVLMLDDDYRWSTSDEGQINTMNGGDGDDLMFLTTEDLPEDHVVAYGGAGADTFVLEYDGAPQVPEIRDFDRDEDTLFIHTPAAIADPGEVRLVDWADGNGADLYLGDTLLAKVTGAAGLDPSAVELGVADHPENVTLEGTDGDDSLRGGQAHDTLLGGDGDDWLSGSSGDDLLDGGAGDDNLRGDSGDDLLRGGDGNDVLVGGSGADALEGGAGDDELTESGQGSTLDGGDGDDILRGGNGAVMTGGAGADTFDILTPDPDSGPSEVTDFDPAEDVLELSVRRGADDDSPFSSQVEVVDWANGEGADIYLNGTLMAKVTGAAGLDPDMIRLDITVYGDNPSPITGGSQDDTLRTDYYSGNTVDGGAGDDQISGGGHLIGGAGNDVIEGEGRLEGGDGNDIVELEFSADTGDSADGGDGDDLLIARAGTLTGGAGADTFSLIARGYEPDPITITDFDPSEDQLILRDFLRDDIDAELRVVDWADGTGADLYLGDTLVAKVTGAAGLDPSAIQQDRPYHPDSQELLGTDEADALIGGAGHDILIGGAGGDTLDGGADGLDVLMGGAGDDILRGGAGDLLNGGTGDDTLSAYVGATMTGGAGADVFGVKDWDGDGTSTAPSVITDFDPSEDDLTLSAYWTEGYTPSFDGTVQVVDWEDGAGADIYLNGFVVAKVTGAAGLDPASIKLNLLVDGPVAGPLTGGDQDDTIRVVDEWNTATIDGGAGDDNLRGGGHLIGGAGNDTIEGSGRLEGGAGDDQIFLSTQAGVNDTVDGGEGDDRIQALTGTLTGGADADTFEVVTGDTSAPAVVITDFDPSEDDLTLNLGMGDGSPMPLRVVDWADGTGADIYLGDYLAVKATGAAGLDPAAVTVLN